MNQTRMLKFAVPTVLLALMSTIASVDLWHLINRDSALGLWLFALPDLVVLHLAPGPRYFVLVDTLVYLAQSAATVGAVGWWWRAAQKPGAPSRA